MQIDIESLKVYESNARTHTKEQIEKVCKSIKEFGFNNPILVDKRNTIIAGHCRYLAAKKLGMEQVPVRVLEHLDSEKMKAYILADNRLALDAGWDEEILSLEIKNLIDKDFDVYLTGFSQMENILMTF